MSKPWEDKANRIISELCLDAYRKANPKPRKKHVPYSVPETASDLVDCLKRGDEILAKSIFIRLAVTGY